MSGDSKAMMMVGWFVLPGADIEGFIAEAPEMEGVLTKNHELARSSDGQVFYATPVGARMSDPYRRVWPRIWAVWLGEFQSGALYNLSILIASLVFPFLNGLEGFAEMIDREKAADSAEETPAE